MKRTLGVIVGDILEKHQGKKLSGHDIAEIIVKTEREFVAKKVKRTGKEDKVLVFQLMSEIGSQAPKMKRYCVNVTSTKPIKYFYKKTAEAAKAIALAEARQSARKNRKPAVKAEAKAKAVKKTKVKTKKTVVKK